MPDYPLYFFSCGCVLNSPEYQVAKNGRKRNIKCPNHQAKVIDREYKCLVCGKIFRHSGSLSRVLKYCSKDCSFEAYQEQTKRWQINHRIEIQKAASVRTVRVEPPIIYDDPRVAPCERCKIHLAGQCKSLSIVCRLCELRVWWDYQTQIECIGY